MLKFTLKSKQEVINHVSKILTFNRKTWKTEETAKSRIINNKADLIDLSLALKDSSSFSFDIETADSLDVVCNPQIVGIGFYSEHLVKPAFIPLGFNSLSNQLPIQTVVDAVRPLFLDDKSGRLAIAHNAKFDSAGLEFYGLNFDWKIIRCSQVLSHLVDENLPSGLKPRVFIEFGHKMVELKELQGKRNTKKFIAMADLPVDKIAEYCGEDAYWTYKLYHKLYKQLQKDPILERYYLEIENPFVETLKKIHARGVNMDWKTLAALDEQLGTLIEAAESKIHKIIMVPINLNSPKQKADLLFNKLKLHKAAGGIGMKRTKGGDFSTDKEVLLELEGLHPVIAPMLEYSALSKLKKTYTSGLPKKVYRDGRIHTHFNQAAVVTGRLSSSDPNLQNIPQRSKLGKQIRLSFVAPPGHDLIVADYSNIELRLLAHESKEKIMIEKFLNGEDLHSLTASMIYDLPLNQCDKATPEGSKRRDAAKTLNFGIIYGMGAPKLSKSLKISQEEAQEFIEKYFDLYPGVRAWIKRVQRFAQQNGYVRTLFGRKRRLPDAMDDSEGREAFKARMQAFRQAVNSIIQGSQAEIIKLAMNKIEKQVPKAKMRLQVHDEIVATCRKEYSKDVAEEIRARMMYPTKDDKRQILCIPMTIDIHIVEKWGMAK